MLSNYRLYKVMFELFQAMEYAWTCKHLTGEKFYVVDTDTDAKYIGDLAYTLRVFKPGDVIYEVNSFDGRNFSFSVYHTFEGIQ